MKKLVFYTLILTLTLILQGWSLFKIFNKHEGPENGFVWYEIKENGLYGAVDKNDNILLPCQFQSIELSNDWKDGNKYNEYEWQLRWNVIDNHDKNLEIRLYIYEDGWRYYSLYDTKSQKSAIADRSYNIIIPFSTCKIETTYGTKDALSLYHVDWAPCIAKCHLFYQYQLFGGAKRGLYTENGTPIIPLERGYSSIFPCCASNRCWYLCNCNSETVVCDSHGTEICRFNTEGSKGYSKFDEYGNERELPMVIEKYKWMGDMDYYYPIAYDAEKGFTCFYEVCDRDGYPIYDSDGDRIYKLHHTGIKLSSNSSSFDVKPSGNNEPARTINLRTYTQRSGSVYPSNNNYSGGYPSMPTTSSQTTSQESQLNLSPQKQWRTVTREETCHFCHGDGKCSTCNGSGWMHVYYTGEDTPCPNCRNGKCPHCNGTGKVTKTERVYE